MKKNSRTTQGHKKIATIFSEAIRPPRKIEIDSLANVLAVAIVRHLAFYDASYSYIAEKSKHKISYGRHSIAKQAQSCAKSQFQ